VSWFASVPMAGVNSYRLMHRRRRDVTFYAFDLLWRDGTDLRQLTLVERKRRLRRLIEGRAGLLFPEQIAAGTDFVTKTDEWASGKITPVTGQVPRQVQQLSLC
jgi:ATP-dependent DNA ligase